MAINPFRKNVPAAKPNGHEEAVAHRFTLDLSRADKFAAMVASSRASHVIEVSDLLAGMYIHNWERLSRYWMEEEHDRVEEIFRHACQISPARWNSWIQQYDKKRHDSDKRVRSLPFLRKLGSEPIAEQPLQRSAELNAIFKQAGELAPFHDSSEGKKIPILTSECVLLCVVRNRKSDISRRLAGSGIDVPQLEKDALSSRRSPKGPKDDGE
jgi:hypothetical protein